MTYFYNRRPFGTDVCRTINEDTRYTVKASDFGFRDYDWGQTMSGVRIDTLSGGGRLLLGGVVVAAGQFITKADIDAGKLVFEPAANASGNSYANFTFSVRDSAGAFDDCPNCFRIDVCPVNDAPDARDDSATTQAGTAVTINVKANDSDPDNTHAELKVTQATLVDPAKGTVVVNADGTVTYKPAAGVTGLVEIKYTIKDPGGLTDTAKVLVDVQPGGSVKQCVLFDFSGKMALDGPDGNTLAYSVSGVSVKVTAFARADDTGAWSKAYVGAYGGGLGVTDNSEGNGGNNSHTVDNLGCRDNYLVFSFDQQVVLDKAYLGYVVCDSDIKVWIGTIDGAYGQPPNLSDATLASMGFTEVNQTTLTSARWADLNAGGFAGNVIIIAADTTDMTPEDQFKLQQLAVCTVPVADNPPEGADATRTIAEDTAYTVLAADLGFSDRDAGQTLAAVRIDTLPADGRLLLGDVAVTAGQLIPVAALNAGQLRLVPDADESGSPYASFTFSVQDSSGRFDTAPNTFVLNVTPVNDGPVGNADAATTPEDTPVSGNVLANDTDLEGDTLAVTGFSVAGLPGSFGPGQTATIDGVGSLTITAAGGYTFNPAPDYHGPVPVATYSVSDGNGGSATATLTITVTPVNDDPVANPDLASTPEDTPVSGNVLANDTDIDSPTLTVTRYSVGGQAVAAGASIFLAEGVLTLNPNGSYNFQPRADFNGSVPVVTYEISDGNGGTASSTLTITVTPVNDAPVANPDTATTPENTPATGNVLANDTDVEGDDLLVTGFTVQGVPGAFNPGDTADLPGIGSLRIDADGGWRFVPAPGYNGPVPVATYTVSDGNGGNASATLTVNVSPVNDAPVANPDARSTPEDTPLTGNVITNDTDPEGDDLTVTGFTVAGLPGSFGPGQVATLVGVGSLVINQDGSYTFNPAADYFGPVPVATYTVSDGNGGTASSTLTIDVTPVNDPPAAAPDAVSTPEDTPATGNVLANDGDVDGDTLSVTGFTIDGLPGTVLPGETAFIAGIGSLSIQPDGRYNFEPAPNYFGPVPVVTYTVIDGHGGSASSTLSITVTPVNDPPVGTPDTNAGPAGQTLTGNVLANDTDIDLDTLRVTSFSVPGLGSFAAGSTAFILDIGELTIEADGRYTFVPSAGFFGPVPVATYTLTDGQAEASTTLTLNISEGNRAPTISSAAASLSEEGLPGGLADANGAPDTTDATSIGGPLVIADADGDPVTVTLEAPTAAYSSGGVVITWSGTGTATLIGSAGGTEILRASIAGGGYTVTVSGPIDHPVQGAEDAITIALGLRASDGQASSTALLNVTLEDDAPAAANVVQTVPDGTQRTNIMLILDISGSMTDDSGVFDAALGRTLNRLELQQQAVERLLTAYDAQGDVRVRIIAFSSNAEPQGTEWTDVATARAQLGTLVAGGFTNYDEPLTDAMVAFEDAGKLELAQNVTYFLSDGNPNTPDGQNFGTDDDGVQLEEELAWRAFLDTNGMNSFAIGLGAGGVVQANIDPVAYDGAQRENTDGFVVTDLAQLADVLTATVENASTGRLGVATGSLAANAFGADGGRVLSVTVDGSTYAFDPANGGAVSVTGPDAGVFLTETNALRIQTNAGGIFQVDLDDGTYRYAAPQSSIFGGDQIGFVLVDGDGDTAAGSLTLQAPGGGGLNPGGEDGADVFRWTLADAGSPGQPSQLQASGYDPTQDTLDLRDLLVGETVVGGGIGNLEDYLSFQAGAGGTQMLVSSRGGFSGGDFTAGAHDATVSLNTDLLAGLGLAASANDAQIIGALLQRNKLVVDQA